MKVVLYAADEGGCGHYRMIWPGQRAATGQSEIEVQLVRMTDPEARIQVMQRDVMQTVRHRGHTMRMPVPEVLGVVAPEADLIVLQRPRNKWLVDAIPFLQAKGVAVAVELDDDFLSIHSENVANVAEQGWSHNGQHLLRACHLADHVIVTTTALANRYGRPGRVSVVPNYIPADIWQRVEPMPVPRTFGWSGSLHTHPTDLDPMCGPLRRVLADADGWTFRVVGTGEGKRNPDGTNGPGIREKLMLDSEPDTTGWVDLELYPFAMASIAVGVVPLAMTPFNQAKSWLKGLEFAAAGVPFIATDTDPYRQLEAQHGLGWLAHRPNDWHRFLRHFAGMPEEERAGIGAEYRRRVLADLTIEGHIGEWVNAWKAALDSHARSAA